MPTSQLFISDGVRALAHRLIVSDGSRALQSIPHRVEVVMPSVRRTCCVLFALLVLPQTFGAATAAPANRQAISQVSQLILNSYDLLNHNEIEAARAECAKALALEEKYDSDPFIAATVQVCFGDVEDHKENTTVACQHYNQALKKFHETPSRHPAQRVLRNQIKAVEGKIFYLSCAPGAAQKK
jgi:hypothetical protein